MQRIKHALLFAIMCSNGGFLGAYAILCRSDNFALAQTVNLIHLILAFLHGDHCMLWARLASLALFLTGIVLSTLFSRIKRFSSKRLAILVLCAGYLLLPLIPASTDPFLAVLPVFFLASMLWMNFDELGGYKSSPIFSTNNLRQFVSACCEYLLEHRAEQKKKLCVFGLSLASYHVGIVLSYLAWTFFSVNAILVCVPFLLVAFLLTF